MKWDEFQTNTHQYNDRYTDIQEFNEIRSVKVADSHVVPQTLRPILDQSCECRASDGTKNLASFVAELLLCVSPNTSGGHSRLHITIDGRMRHSSLFFVHIV